MKITHRVKDEIMAMANLHSKRTGLAVNIWSDGQGCLRNKPDAVPRVKIACNGDQVSVSIEEHPQVLAPKSWKTKFKKSSIKAIEEGVEYVGRNFDLFMKHYQDTDGSFDDYDLFEALKERNQFK